MTITLITGGNKGLGHEAARRLIAAGHTVYIGARDNNRGKAAADALGARFVQLDVTDDTSVKAAIAHIADEARGLDVLINNAGIAGGRALPAEVTADDIRQVYETNVFGVVRVTHEALPLLAASPSPVIVNVASGLGSLGVVTDPERMESRYPVLAYGSSKSAVISLTVQYAKALPAIRINAVDPGYTATDMNGRNGTQTVTEGTDAIVRMATITQDGPTGGFYDRNGVVPW
ncbi:MAG TPA: SDR family NAD(P)-dependent oxidoreductase [Pseudonocardiaceae bacterium]|jgi:NAD(P)-dependent dehydrogenase (short-subunit alcohol dehydrogenase family)|nr:SDR family NAD(P)-dependent oxidoreductase [Pseudonocardiaceae bacterium]